MNPSFSRFPLLGNGFELEVEVEVFAGTLGVVPVLMGIGLEDEVVDKEGSEEDVVVGVEEEVVVVGAEEEDVVVVGVEEDAREDGSMVEDEVPSNAALIF